MGWTGFQYFVVVVLVITGIINTLGAKWADGLHATNRNGEMRKFNHPFFQATVMFFAEIWCFVVFKILYAVYSRRNDGSEDVNELTKGNRNFNFFKLFIPAMCDMTSSSLMFIGLNLTYALSYQMLKGAIIIFVALLSVGFLDRVLKRSEWFGIVLITLGLSIIGVGDFISKDNNADIRGPNAVITGDLLIVLAQIIGATQMVVEEKLVAGLDIPPLQAIGWQGIFGFLVLGGLQIPFYYIKVGPPFSDNPRGVLEDAVDAFVQIGNSSQLLFALLGTMLSIAFFNFAYITIIKEMSATTCMVLDNIRTVVIWIVSVLFMGQPFRWLQLIGYLPLLAGMCIYNGITFTDRLVKIGSAISNLRYRKLTENTNVGKATV